MTENTTIAENKKEIKIESFLSGRKVKVTPILTKDFTGQVLEQLPDGFIADGSKNDLPLRRDNNTGRFVQIFDTVTRKYTKEFPTENLTELEWYSKMYGRNMDVHAPRGENMWEGLMLSKDVDPNRIYQPYYVQLPKEGFLLDLSTVDDNIKYKVLLTWSDARIAPSWENRYDRPNYMFALVDEKVSIDRKKEAIKLELEAMEEFNKIKGSKELLIEFLVVKDPVNPLADTVSEDFVFGQVYDVMKSNPKLFLLIAKDPDREDKLLVYNACKSGAIKKNNDKYFTLSDEPLGKLGEVLSRLKDPEKLEFRKRIEAQVDNYKG